MAWFSALAIYIVIWMLCLFVVLPFGVRSQHEADIKAPPGHDHGAPAQASILKKFIITSLLALVVFIFVYFILVLGALDWLLYWLFP